MTLLKVWQVCWNFDVLRILKILLRNLLVSHLNKFIYLYPETRVYELEPLNLSQSDTISCILSTLEIKHDNVGNNGHLPILWYDRVSITSPVSNSA